ncbi:MAG: DUF4910 domain-containing protein [Anaerolineae bacterium]
MEIARYLVEKIGPRWAGRSGAAQAAQYLAEKFTQLGLQVMVQDFPFVGWEVDDSPVLEVLEPQPGYASVALMEYSGSTPAEGLEGMLRPAGQAGIVPGFLDWPRYAIVSNDNKPSAYLIAHIGLAGWFAPAIPLANPEPFYPFPMAILSQADHQRFQDWLNAGESIRVRFHVRGHYAEHFVGHNVIATLPGDTERTVVLCAHIDTAYGTPGANNNACGVQALYHLAQELMAMPNRRLIYQFLACDATEWHYLGSRFFVQEARAQGWAGNILAGINLDTIASGDQLYFLAWPQNMRDRAERVVNQLKLRERFRTIEFLGALAGSDHYSFIQAGIPASEILFWPCPVYKTPEDDMRYTDEKLVTMASEIAYALVRTFEEEEVK